MPMTLDQLVDESRQLPQDVRAELVERILVAAHGGIAPQIEAAWKQETRRRIEDIQAGRAKGIPLEEALADARKRLGL
ncbi:MAG: addiction module protein [Verrucomicrobia bacterium]|nr:addiction module protein [Verrucomicrobiota bacterium]